MGAGCSKRLSLILLTVCLHGGLVVKKHKPSFLGYLFVLTRLECGCSHVQRSSEEHLERQKGSAVETSGDFDFRR